MNLTLPTDSQARQVVGFYGHYGSGKDEAAKPLIALGWQRVSFAEPLRAMALAINPIVSVPRGTRLSQAVELFGWTEAKKLPEVRGFLQRLGTEGVRNILGENTWVELAERTMSADKSVVFTDCRFSNEVALVRKYGGKLIQIRRPGCKPAQSHVSEEYPFEPDATIINDGTIAGLHAKVLQELHEGYAGAPLAPGARDCRELDRMRERDADRLIG